MSDLLNKDSKEQLSNHSQVSKSKKGKAKKNSFFKEVSAEFKKISWPKKETLFKQSVAVICVSAVVGLVITLLDTVIKFGV